MASGCPGQNWRNLVPSWKKFEFAPPHLECIFCSGYYGPNFKEPTCATCHAFLFPESFEENDPHVRNIEKSDDEDSGNEEPTERSEESEFSFNSALRLARAESTSAARAESRADVPKSDQLSQQIAHLTLPRELEVFSSNLDVFPPEVLSTVFSYLDDLSLWIVGEVCKRWKSFVEDEVADDKWEEFISVRWPLFKPYIAVSNWWDVYGLLVRSAPCLTCLHRMGVLKVPMEIHEESLRRRRLREELRSFRMDPPEGILAEPLEKTLHHWQAAITGPVGSPYEGGLFFIYLSIEHTYPMKPPHVKFMTKVFHPNVSRHGDIGIDTILHNWSSGLTIPKVLISIQSLFTDPHTKVCMEPVIGALFEEDHSLFTEIARQWTWKFAMHEFISAKQGGTTS